MNPTIFVHNFECYHLSLLFYQRLIITVAMFVFRQSIENAIPIVTSGMAVKDCSEVANDIMSAFSSMLSVDLVARTALTNDQVLSNPSSYAAALNWITTSIMKHGEA